MLDSKEYAARIYCLVFEVDDDDGDTCTDGVMVAISKLDERDRVVLECRYRQGMTCKKAGMQIGGVTGARASYIARRAINRLKDNRGAVSKMSISGKKPKLRPYQEAFCRR